MARSESDREDLLREATALIDRAVLRIPGEPEPVTIGFRAGGSFSIFFGSDPVYQFNAAGQLRRAFVRGVLYKAEQGRLVGLDRVRTADGVALVRTELGTGEAAQMLQSLWQRLSFLLASMDKGDCQLVGEVSVMGDTLARFRSWFASLPADMPIASRPNVDAC
jgi:hypothetical protein